MTLYPGSSALLAGFTQSAWSWQEQAVCYVQRRLRYANAGQNLPYRTQQRYQEQR